MNNLNAPGENWNILPNRRDGDGGGSKWDYIALASLLAVPAFNFITQKRPSKKHLQDLLQNEQKWETEARIVIEDNEDSLVERQRIYCSPYKSKKARLELEKKMLSQAAANSIAKELGIDNDLEYIFKNETHCEWFLNRDPKKNGKIMWVILDNWKKKAEDKKYKKIEGALFGGKK